MSVVRSGFLWQSAIKHPSHQPADWIPANLEITGRPNKLSLIADPVDPIYETLDEDDRKIRFRVNSFKRCIKVTQKVVDRPVEESGSLKTEPPYQVLLQKRRLLKGEELKIGFNEKSSQRLFLVHIKEALKENKKLNSSRLHLHKRNKVNDTELLKKQCDINEIDKFMTENSLYEVHGWSAIKVRILPTDLANRLQLRGIYLIEFKDCDMCLLDYITMSEINKWPFKQIRSFGFNEQRLYLLTGSNCVGGRGLMVFESEKCEELMNRLVCMMKSVAGESESVTEENHSPSPIPRGTRSPQAPSKSSSRTSVGNVASTPSKKLMHDLSASLQDFCRTHCCTLPPLRGRTENNSVEVVTAGVDQYANESQILNGDGAKGCETDDNLSLDEGNEEVKPAEGDFSNLVKDEVGEKADPTKHEVETKPLIKEDSPKENRHRALRTSSLKKSITDFIASSMARIESFGDSTHPTKSTSVTNSTLNNTTALRDDQKSQSLTETHRASDSSEGEATAAEHRQSKRTESAKTVQLIKWRDLPGREDYYGSTSTTLVGDTQEQTEDPDHESSETSGQEVSISRHVETPSMQEDTSMPSSSSTARDFELASALKSNMMAFTSF